jgi:hypothetical protein
MSLSHAAPTLEPGVVDRDRDRLAGAEQAPHDQPGGGRIQPVDVLNTGANTCRTAAHDSGTIMTGTWSTGHLRS